MGASAKVKETATAASAAATNRGTGVLTHWVSAPQQVRPSRMSVKGHSRTLAQASASFISVPYSSSGTHGHMGVAQRTHGHMGVARVVRTIPCSPPPLSKLPPPCRWCCPTQYYAERSRGGQRRGKAPPTPQFGWTRCPIRPPGHSPTAVLEQYPCADQARQRVALGRVPLDRGRTRRHQEALDGTCGQ